MNPSEKQLHDLLTRCAPSSVDTTGWAEVARVRANRTRIRATVAVTLGVVLILGASITGLVHRDARPAPVPARTVTASPADTYGALCRADLTEVGPFPADGPPSMRYAVMALCPEALSDPSWAQLPQPALLSGTRLDLLASSGGPPVENCEHGHPTLPGFSVVARDLRGNIVGIPGATQRCFGAQFAQSFSSALAEQVYDTSHPAGSACSGIREVDASPPPRLLSNATTVHLCVTADPFVEAEPSPLRHRPLLDLLVSDAQRKPLLDAVAGASMGSGRYTDCPWRHAMIYVVATDDAGARKAAVVRCRQDYNSGDSTRLATMRGLWPVLDASSEHLLIRQAAGYLQGRPSR